MKYVAYTQFPLALIRNKICALKVWDKIGTVEMHWLNALCVSTVPISTQCTNFVSYKRKWKLGIKVRFYKLKANLLFFFNRLNSQILSGMYVVFPWDNSLHMVQVQSNKEITLPFIYTAKTDKQLEVSEHYFFNLDVESYYYKKVSTSLNFLKFSKYR